MTAETDAWMETCLVTITPVGGSAKQYASLTDTIDFSFGAKDVEGIALVNGGRVTKFMPEEDTEITLETYPLEVGTSSGTTGQGFFDLMHTADGSEPQLINNDRTRTKHRAAFLWTEDTSLADAEGQPSSSEAAMRLTFAKCYITKVDPEFTDDELKFTITMKVIPDEKDGTSTHQFESQKGDGSNQITALSSFTTSNNF